ncbi:MAG: hypothetical protein JW810_12485 [Sedimentisphaerales bacterium]|nr:hypothetical protein [Sedimentisphaerales bacterium]
MIFGRFRRKRSNTDGACRAADPSCENPPDAARRSGTTDAVGAQDAPDFWIQYSTWPVRQPRYRVKWYPARQRLIGLVRGNRDAYVLPPAVVRKASWRD